MGHIVGAICPQKGKGAGLVMITQQQREIMIAAVLRHGAGVLHRNGYARLLARHSNLNRVNDTLDILYEAGFFTRAEGAFNADLFISDGRLEAAHKHYLERLIDAVKSRL